MSRTLYVHLGHSKTGSSYLQSIFWKNRECLQAKNIDYPLDEYSLMYSKDTGKFSFWGNAMFLFRDAERLENFFAACSQSTQNVLLSSESVIYNSEIQGEREEIPFEKMYSAGFDEIKILLFVRNPLDHAVSLWNQICKSYYKILYPRVDDYIRDYSFPATIQEYLEKILKEEKVTLEVYNYDSCKKQMLPLTERWLGLEPGFFSVSDEEVVNRSLQPQELDVLIRHKLKADSGETLLNDLMEAAGHSTSSLFVPSLSVQQEMWERNLSHIAFINALLPETEKLQFRPLRGRLQDEGPISFNTGQINALVNYYLHKHGRFAQSSEKDGVDLQDSSGNMSDGDRVKKKRATIKYRLWLLREKLVRLSTFRQAYNSLIQIFRKATRLP